MTPKQALEILDRVTSTVQLSRQDHQHIIIALQTLDGIIKQLEVAEQAPEAKK